MINPSGTASQKAFCSSFRRDHLANYSIYLIVTAQDPRANFGPRHLSVKQLSLQQVLRHEKGACKENSMSVQHLIYEDSSSLSSQSWIDPGTDLPDQTLPVKQSS